MEPTEQRQNSPGSAEPAIRTMQSDIARYVGDRKVSLASIAAAASDGSAPSSSGAAGHFGPLQRRLALGGLGFFILAALFLGGWHFLQPAKQEIILQDQAEPAALTPDGEEHISVASRQSLLEALGDLGRWSGREGAMRRIVFRIQDGNRSRPIALSEFFAFLEAAAPQPLEAKEPPQFFLYAADAGPTFVLVFKPLDRARSLAALYAWEPEALSDLLSLSFAPAEPTSEISEAHFEDKTYRNIDYRLASANPESARGFGYLYFPAKGLIIMTTSETAIEATVDRLFLTP